MCKIKLEKGVIDVNKWKYVNADSGFIRVLFLLYKNVV